MRTSRKNRYHYRVRTHTQKLALQKIEFAISPTLEEKKRGIEALQLLQAPEVEEVRALLEKESKPIKTAILYGETIFDIPVSAEVFSAV